jgi:hypothetical protein
MNENFTLLDDKYIDLNYYKNLRLAGMSENRSDEPLY